MNTIEIKTEFIKLDSFLKFSGICSTGGEAKIRIEQGDVKVNNETCFQRGKKLRNGDKILVDNQTYDIIKI